MWQASCISYTPTFQKLSVVGPALVANDATCPAAAAPNSVTAYAYDALNRLTGKTTPVATDLPQKNRTPFQADFRSIWSGVRYPMAE
jgi:hypothetical protein